MTGPCKTFHFRPDFVDYQRDLYRAFHAHSEIRAAVRVIVDGEPTSVWGVLSLPRTHERRPRGQAAGT